MTGQTAGNEPDRIDAAFNRVLAAEAQARAALQDCRRECAALLAAAESRARAIAERTDLRVRRAHTIADAGVARALDALKAQDPAQCAQHQPTAPPDWLDRAIALLADEILGTAARPEP